MLVYEVLFKLSCYHSSKLTSKLIKFLPILNIWDHAVKFFTILVHFETFWYVWVWINSFFSVLLYLIPFFHLNYHADLFGNILNDSFHSGTFAAILIQLFFFRTIGTFQSIFFHSCTIGNILESNIFVSSIIIVDLLLFSWSFDSISLHLLIFLIIWYHSSKLRNCFFYFVII